MSESVSVFSRIHCFCCDLLIIFKAVFMSFCFAFGVLLSVHQYMWCQDLCFCNTVVNSLQYWRSASKGKTPSDPKMMKVLSLFCVQSKKAHVILNGIRGETSKWAPFSKTTSCPCFPSKPVHNAIYDCRHSCEEMKSTIRMNVRWPFSVQRTVATSYKPQSGA